MIEGWDRGKSSFSVLAQAVRHFSEVDIYRMYSLFIRAAHHMIDVYVHAHCGPLSLPFPASPPFFHILSLGKDSQKQTRVPESWKNV